MTVPEGGRRLIDGLDLKPLPRGGAWRDGVIAAMPAAAIVLLVGLLGFLLWAVAADERERARTTLISDALWVEQTLRFQLATNEDMLSRLALDVMAGSASEEVFLSRARLHVANNPEVIAIAWFDGSGAVRAAVPSVPSGATPSRAGLDLVNLSRFSARPIYGQIRTSDRGRLVADIAMPLPSDGAETGALVATFSIEALMTRHVPWWIAEQYAVRLTDTSGTLLAEKARVEPLPPELGHAISFNPPLAGTVLSITPYRPQSNWSNNVLYALIIGLAVLAVVSLVALQRHVARRRRVEQQLVTETIFRRAMENSLTVGMRARDHDGRILYVNPAFCAMVGFTAEELVGQSPPMPYWLPDEIEATRARHDAQIRGELKPKSWETRFLRRDGTVFDALLYEAPLIDVDGQTRGWMGSIIDITDRKAQAELARRQADSLQRTGRLVTLGEMASTLAHELNQPLAAIASYATGSLNLLEGGHPDTGALRGALQKLAVQAQRAGQIIRRIQDFVRKREPRFGRVDIAEVIADTVAFATVDARNSGVRIEIHVMPGLPPVAADRILVEQLLLNLVRNGVEAMSGEAADRRMLSVSAALNGSDLVIEIADRGPGIEGVVSGRIFDAFVSTKPEGMGMGLNICRSIVELHKGRLAHAPREGGGTVFTVVLPAGEERAAA